MKFTELKEKTELKNYVKNLTDTITDNDIDICHDEQNDSPQPLYKKSMNLIYISHRTVSVQKWQNYRKC